MASFAERGAARDLSAFACATEARYPRWVRPRDSSRLTVEGSKTATRGVYSVDFIGLSDWKGSLNSALNAGGLPLLPAPLGSLTWRQSSTEAKKALGLSEKEGTREFCPALLPQIGRRSIFCRLAWDKEHRLDEVQFSSGPFDLNALSSAALKGFPSSRGV